MRVGPHRPDAVGEHEPARRRSRSASRSCRAGRSPTARWATSSGRGRRPVAEVVGAGDALRRAVVTGQRGEPPADPAREQGQALVGGGRPEQRRRREAQEVGRGSSCWLMADAVEGGVRGVVGDRAVVVDEPDEPGVLHAVGLGGRSRARAPARRAAVARGSARRSCAAASRRSGVAVLGRCGGCRAGRRARSSRSSSSSAVNVGSEVVEHAGGDSPSPSVGERRRNARGVEQAGRRSVPNVANGLGRVDRDRRRGGRRRRCGSRWTTGGPRRCRARS